MNRRTHPIELVAAWLLALLWLAPLAYAFWSALHPAAYATSFSLSAPWTLENFSRAWSQAPFGRYYLNTIMLVCLVLAGQLVLSTLAAYAFARFKFKGSGIAFALVLLQLMIMPDVLIVENYRAISAIGLLDTIPAIALPYLASAFAIFLARIEGAGPLQVLWRVYVPLARPTYIAFALVSVSYHWNNFLWPLIVTNSVSSRPLTVGLAVFGAPETGVDWSIISAATVMTMAPLLIAFLLFQRQFVQSFMRAGIR
jgi:sn-glycerol 3-phosphate transport system permease protein